MSTYRAVLTGNQVKAAKKVYEHPEECERVCDIEKHAQTVSAMLEAEQKGDFAASAELARAAADERETVQKKREGEKKERKAAEKERKAMELQKRKERFAKTVAALNRNASEKQSTAVDKAGPTTAKAGPSNPPNPEHLRSRPTRTFHRVWPCPRAALKPRRSSPAGEGTETSPAKSGVEIVDLIDDKGEATGDASDDAAGEASGSADAVTRHNVTSAADQLAGTSLETGKENMETVPRHMDELIREVLHLQKEEVLSWLPKQRIQLPEIHKLPEAV